jgi:hypothetical protein
MVQSAKALGWWSALTWVNFFGAPNGGHLINVKNPAQKLTAQGTPGTVTWGTGWQGDGVSSYLDTTRTPSQLGMSTDGTNCSLTSLVYSQTDIPGATTCCGSIGGGNNTGAIRLRSGAVMSVWMSGSSNITIPVQSGVGLAGVIIQTSNRGAAVKGASFTAIQAAVPALATTTFRYGKCGTSAGVDPNQLAYGFAGPGITTDQASDINNQTYLALIALGTYIPPPIFESVGPSSCFVRDVLTVTPGADNANVGRIATPPTTDGQQGYATYSQTVVQMGTPAGNMYTMTDADLDKELWINTGGDSGWIVVQLPPATSANIYRRAIIRKADYTNGGITTAGSSVSINRQYDVLIYVSTGTGWQANNNWVPYRRIAGNSVTWDGSNNYQITAADMARGYVNLHPGNVNCTVTLGLTTTMGPGNIFFRKMDSGTGTITFSGGVVLTNKFDYCEFVSTGSGAWQSGTDFFDIGDQPFDSITHDYYCSTYDLAQNVEPAVGATNSTVHLLSASTLPANTVQVVRYSTVGANTATVTVDAPGQGVLATMTALGDWRGFRVEGGLWVDRTSLPIWPLDLGYIFPIGNIQGRPWSLNQYRQTKVPLWNFMWRNRGLGSVAGEIIAWDKKPNDTMGVMRLPATAPVGGTLACGAEFDTYQLAMAASWIQAMYSLGYLARNDTTLLWFDDVYRATGWGWLDVADHMGYDTSAWAPYAGDPSTLYKDVNVNTGPIAHHAYFAANTVAAFPLRAVSGSYMVCRNNVILGQDPRFSDLKAMNVQPCVGVIWDDEAADSCPPDQFVRQVRGICRACHGKGYQVGFGGHVLGSGTATQSGWTVDNAWQLFSGPPNVYDGLNENLDYRIVITDNGPSSVAAMLALFDQQTNFLTGPNGDKPIPWSKMQFELRMGGNNQEISSDKVAALKTWRDQHGIFNGQHTPVYGAFGGFMTRTVQQRVAQLYNLPIVHP